MVRKTCYYDVASNCMLLYRVETQRMGLSEASECLVRSHCASAGPLVALVLTVPVGFTLFETPPTLSAFGLPGTNLIQ